MDWITGSGPAGTRRSIRPLVGAWLTYWAGLAGWTLWALRTPVSLYLRLRQQMPGRAALLFNDELKVQVLVDHRAVWSAGVSALELAAWVAGPPLLVWVAWLLWTARARSAARLGAPAPTPKVGAGDTDRWLAQPRPGEHGAAEARERQARAVDRAD